MASYIDVVVTKGEQVVYRAQTSAWNHAFGFFLVALFIFMTLIALTDSKSNSWIAYAIITGICVLPGIINLSAFTDRRVIAKKGWIRLSLKRRDPGR